MRKESALVSFLIHVAVIAILLTFAVRATNPARPAVPTFLSNRKLTAYFREPSGAGQHLKNEASPGHLPPPSPRQFVMPLLIPVNTSPKLPMVSSLDLPPDLPNSALPNIGDPTGLGKLLSAGTGGPAGIGDGNGHRVGPDSGTGAGPDGEVFRPGHGVTMPVPIHRVEPEYPDEARKARATGTVIVTLEVGPDGKPRNVRVARGLGLGLDERATEAVLQWRFKPGTKDGKPVAVAAQIELTFHLL